MARSPRVRSTLRRVADVALEDFGVRRGRERSTAPGVDDHVTPTAPGDDAAVVAAPIVDDHVTPSAPVVDDQVTPATPVTALPTGIVWHGAARRRPELQRFCDHLGALRRVS